MKKLLLGSILSLTLTCAQAQSSNPASGTESNNPAGQPLSDKDRVLASINAGLENATRQNEQAAAQLKAQAEQLATAIRTTRDADAKANLLTRRIQLLETRQEELDKNELLVYQANYQSAMVNLVSMDREIKPVKLFAATRQFFTTLDAVGNPTSYDGYKEFLKEFEQYVKRNQAREATFKVVNNLLTLTGDLTGNIPFSGPVAQMMLSSTASFVSTLNPKEKGVRQKGEQMLLITAKTAQFTHDKELIENQQTVLEKELNDLQLQYTRLLDKNAALLGISVDNMRSNFFTEQDANKRTNYLNSISAAAAGYVGKARQSVSANPKLPNSDWKNEVYRQMVNTQQLKIRFGLVLLRMQENLGQYQALITKYKTDPQLGDKVQGLEGSLRQVQGSFEDAFSPAAYVLAAQEMYKVM